MYVILKGQIRVVYTTSEADGSAVTWQLADFDADLVTGPHQQRLTDRVMTREERIKHGLLADTDLH